MHSANVCLIPACSGRPEMGRRRTIACIIGAIFLLLPASAFAGAWTLPKGEGEIIVTATPSQATKGFDENGKLYSVPRYIKTDLQALIEYGITDYFTLIVTPSLQHAAFGAPIDSQRSGFGYTDFGGRLRVWSNDAWVFSLQSLARLPGTSNTLNPAAVGYTDPEIDFRGLLGYSFKAGTWPAFVDAQIGQRFRFGAPPNEIRADFTFGVRPAPQWLVLVQSFNVISVGEGTGGNNPQYAYHKLQLSAVYALTPTLSVQLGGFETVAGHNAFRERGLILGVWSKF